MSQQVYVTTTQGDALVFAPALIAVWVTTAGNLKIQGKGDAATCTIPVVTGLLNFPYPVQQIFSTGSTAVTGPGVAAGS